MLRASKGVPRSFYFERDALVRMSTCAHVSKADEFVPSEKCFTSSFVRDAVLLSFALSSLLTLVIAHLVSAYA